jgi:eukaryotic-like serine/threonine-protein kinase
MRDPERPIQGSRELCSTVVGGTMVVDHEPVSIVQRALFDPPTCAPWDRYEDLGVIARGGMGEIRRVRDRVLGRVLAMKLLRPELEDRDELRARFLAEARVTASLQHPGIVPVHECGALPDGRLWFTMQEVRGRTLGAAIRALHDDAEPPPEGMRRLIDVLARVCETVAYAHNQGVVHRDLKPDNVMIGEFGEVLVLDWGIARAAAHAPRPLPDAGAAVSPEVGALLRGAHRTQVGGVLGTPSYMAPEQALADRSRIGTRTDVYALGAILYEILSGHAPYADSPDWTAVLFGPPAPLAPSVRGRAPADLAPICERAMAREPADRFEDARALAEEVRRVLDGARRHQRGRALVAEARALAPSIEALRRRAAALTEEARAELARVRAFDPAEAKERGWALEDEAHVLELRASQEEVIWQQKLRAALEEAPDLDEAHEALADAHAAELRAAEAARAAQAAARAEALLAEHDRGRHAAILRGEGGLSLLTAPGGAEVSLWRVVQRSRRLHVARVGSLGRTPLGRTTLPRGSYLLRVRAPRCHEVRYPVLIERGADWDSARPGDREPFAVPLPKKGTLAADDVYVPGGWFLSGGDPAGVESLPGRRIWIDGYVIRRHPVTQDEYLYFLNDLVRRGRSGEAEHACPRAAHTMSGGADIPLFDRDAKGLFRHGVHTPPERGDHPVTLVTWRSALLYASWYAERTGLPYRLVGELEREKAARGVDGRVFPWGDQPETTWACMVSSRPGPAVTAAVSDYPTDESPYGVRGLAGNVRDWCADVWTATGPPVDDGIARVEVARPEDPSMRSVRGGAWSAAPPTVCSAASRFAAHPDERFATVGLRLARSFDPAR